MKMARPKWWFPKIKGTFLGVPLIRTIIYWGIYWGTLILGNYQIEKEESETEVTPAYAQLPACYERAWPSVSGTFL